jgi:hypothetical protein
MSRYRRQYNMRNLMKAAVVAVALAFPAAAFAQGATAAPAQKKSASASAKKAAAVASHTTSGTVKSVSDSSLVISKGTGEKATDETFTVNASTKKTGDVKEGAKVTVAYTTEGGANTATSIKAAAPKMAKASTKKK